MNKSIGILGCGWLGLPLAISLLKEGYSVKGTTTSKEKIKSLKKEGIVPFEITLSDIQIEGDVSTFLKDLEILFINIPPKLRGNTKENYVQKIHLLYKEVKKAGIQKILFVSSTSVYGDVKGEVTEATKPQPSTNSGKQILEAENMFFTDPKIHKTIIRFGGLIGPNRHPVTMLSGRQNLTNGNDVVNLIHLNDCILITKAIIANSWWNEIINGVNPAHPRKRDYYTQKALELNLQPPHYEINSDSKSKIIVPNSLLNVKKFIFTTTL